MLATSKPNMGCDTAQTHSQSPSALVAVSLLASLVPGMSPAQQSDPTTIEEILVLAQKRSENLQQVPISASVMTSQMIEDSGVLSIVELTDLNPSVSFDTAQSWQNSSLKIRGIGTFGNGRTFEGSVGVFIDGVYRPRSGMALQDMLDIERVEVLRGPQDTLFGKNTVAGAIALYSTPPSTTEFSGRAELRSGNAGLFYLNGQLNVPMGDFSGLRLAASTRTRDGFVASPDSSQKYDEIDRESFKAQYYTEATANLSVLLIADYTESDVNCCWGAPQVFNGPTAPLVETYTNLNGLTFTPAPTAEHKRELSLNTSPREKIEDGGVTAVVNWELDSASLKSVTSIREWDHEQIDGDADFGGADLLILNEPSTIDYISQEFNLTFSTDNTDVLLGLYAADEKVKTRRSIASTTETDNFLNVLVSAGSGATQCLPPLIAVDCAFPVGIGALLDNGDITVERYEQDTTSLALFAHAIQRLSDRSNLVLGARYNYEKKNGGVQIDYWYDSPIVRSVLSSLGVPDDGTPRNGFDLVGTVFSPSFSADTKDTEFTGTVAYQYMLNVDTMLYGKYDRGFKAGGVNLFREAIVTNTKTYSPEFANSFEIGLKSDYLNGMARSSVAFFRTEFRDLQINFFDGLSFRTENTGKALSTGAEFENQFQLTDNLRLDFAVTWLDAHFSKIDALELSYLVDRDTPRAPEWSGNIGLNWSRPLANGMSLFARGTWNYRGNHFVGADIVTETKADGYSLTDLTLGIRGPSDRWEVLGWCRNCGDTDYRTILFNSTFQAGSYNAYLNDRRTYGITLRGWF